MNNKLLIATGLAVVLSLFACTNETITPETPSEEQAVETSDAEPVSKIWTGSKITFTKGDDSDPQDLSNQDRITDNVWITRGAEGGQIFNIKVEEKGSSEISPTDTEWALGLLEEYESLEFRPFREAVGKPKEVAGKDLVLHLITDDVYLGVKFLNWSQGQKGGFSYERTTNN